MCIYPVYSFDNTGGNAYNPERRKVGTGRTEAKGGQHATIGCFFVFYFIDFYYCYFRKRSGKGANDEGTEDGTGGLRQKEDNTPGENVR